MDPTLDFSSEKPGTVAQTDTTTDAITVITVF
jgi:hypothetical protein